MAPRYGAHSQQGNQADEQEGEKEDGVGELAKVGKEEKAQEKTNSQSLSTGKPQNEENG